MNGENILSEESALENFQKFVDFYDVDEKDLEDETIKKFIGGIIRAIRRGRLEFEDTEDGLVIHQNLVRSVGGVSRITYSQFNGAAKKAIDTQKGEVAKIHAMMAKLSRESMGFIEKLIGPDYSTMESLAVLFSVA